MKRKNNINVTKTFLPPYNVYNSYLKRIWKSNWITNFGPFSEDLEKKLKDFLSVENLYLVTNGTLGLQLTIRALNIKGDIITTPFSYVASTSSIVWENCKPVFVDINPDTLCIDADKIEKNITKNTKAILAVHVYGNVCDIDRIDFIAKNHNLKVIYDAAHAFNIKYKSKSVLNYGDASILSFHATKIFHTVEGGAIISSDPVFNKNIFYFRNFGHEGAENIVGLGINAKLSELHAVMGLSILPYVKKIIDKRKQITLIYDDLTKKMDITKPLFNKHATRNYGYYPVIFQNEAQLIKIRRKMNQNGIFPRRYFFPSLNTVNYVASASCKISENISKRILCLPLYPELSESEVYRIVKIIKNSL